MIDSQEAAKPPTPTGERSERVLFRRDLAVVVLIAAVALGIRVYAPWRGVFDGDRVNFLETDAWYHVRLIENQVHNWPWRVTFDPYASPEGQFVPIAPLFDTTVATFVVVVHGRDATPRQVERIAAFAPPLFGALAVIVVWALTRAVFDARAGLMAAAFLAVLPGHFLDRTLLGFVDHHALEVLLALTVLWTIARTCTCTCTCTQHLAPGTQHLAPGTKHPALGTWHAAPGIALGLYLLSWASGAFLVAILGGWLLIAILLTRSTNDLRRLARVLGVAALIALVLVLIFQDPRMHRYSSQLLGLIGLAGLALAAHFTTSGVVARLRHSAVVVGVSIVAAASLAIAWFLAPNLLREIWIDVWRLAPDATRLSVLEARPLFLYPGQWTWAQPWIFFRTGFYVGAIALIALAVRVWRRRDPLDIGVCVFAFASFVATIGQNRFGYYLVPACAILSGWLAKAILDWGATARWPLQREIAIIAVVTGMFVPNLAPGAMPTARAGTMPSHWHEAVTWLGANTPPPFSSVRTDRDYYLARYLQPLPAADYTIMNWWDHGYYITQTSRRVPVANPTQARASNAAQFYAATTEAEANAILDRERSRFVLSDWELPFRLAATGTIMGRFQSVIDWAGARHAQYYEVYYRNQGDDWIAVWVFHRPYYESMAYRLSVLGGQSASPENSTSVLTIADRVDTSGLGFREIISQETFATFEAAEIAAAKVAVASGNRVVIAGVDPWRAAFPVSAVTSLAPVHTVRTAEQSATESPWVRIFKRLAR